MERIKLVVLLFLALFIQACIGTNKTTKEERNLRKLDGRYELVTIGFYNIENLFDTINSPDTHDSEFLPDSPKEWNTEKYEKKLDNMSKVISEIGTSIDNDGVDILGLCEVENLKVVLDLVNEKSIRDRHYQVIHGDSPDERGIDVALIFNPRVFVPTGFELLKIDLTRSDGSPDYTRDILYVHGKLQDEDLHIFINHWPSRSGGQAASAPKRNKAAKVCRAKVDSIKASDPNAKIIIMGDLNDDPVSPSVTDYLKVAGEKADCEKGGLYNTMMDYYKNGIGTLAYHDAWNLFDQIIISCPLLDDEQGFQFFSSHIFKRRYLLQRYGAFKGYPFRTFVGDNFMGGYSDHFPVYMYLIKKQEQLN